MKGRIRPAHVRAAVFRSDCATLSRMGSAGGRATARTRAQKREEGEVHAARTAELRQLELWERAVEANEHDVPIDDSAEEPGDA